MLNPPVKFNHNQNYFSEKKKIEVIALKPTNSENQ